MYGKALSMRKHSKTLVFIITIWKYLFMHRIVSAGLLPLAGGSALEEMIQCGYNDPERRLPEGCVLIAYPADPSCGAGLCGGLPDAQGADGSGTAEPAPGPL